MASTFIVTDKLCWMVQNWIHDNILEAMADMLQPDEPALAAMLLDSLTSQNGGYLDLRKYGKETMTKLKFAADAAQKKFEQEGPSSFYSPNAYPGFMQRLGELREMLSEATEE